MGLHRERRKKKAKRGGALLYHEKTLGVGRFVREPSRSFHVSHHVWGIGGDNVGLIQSTKAPFYIPYIHCAFPTAQPIAPSLHPTPATHVF